MTTRTTGRKACRNARTGCLCISCFSCMCYSRLMIFMTCRPRLRDRLETGIFTCQPLCHRHALHGIPSSLAWSVMILRSHSSPPTAFAGSRSTIMSVSGDPPPPTAGVASCPTPGHVLRMGRCPGAKVCMCRRRGSCTKAHCGACGHCRGFSSPCRSFKTRAAARVKPAGALHLHWSTV